MKKYSLLGLSLSFFMFFNVAATAYSHDEVDFNREQWQSRIETNSRPWSRGASQWFLTGEAASGEKEHRRDLYPSPLTTTTVHVPNFTNVIIKGSFRVELLGSADRNSVYIKGPNQEAGQININVKHNTLYVGERQGSSHDLSNVIVRIGVTNLQHLLQLGESKIEAIHLQSNGLSIVSRGTGNMYLSGRIALKQVIQLGSGAINVFGAITPSLRIETSGSGSVNLSGNIGIASIEHHGEGDINIIGANSDSLMIYADGSGKIGIAGIVNLRKILAKDSIHIYLDRVNSPTIFAYVHDNAHVGIAGNTQHFYTYTSLSARLDARYLCSQHTYAKARDQSHMNVTANKNIFASSKGNSSLYFYGTPALLTQFKKDHSTIIPIWDPNSRSCFNTQSIPYQHGNLYPHPHYPTMEDEG